MRSVYEAFTMTLLDGICLFILGALVGAVGAVVGVAIAYVQPPR